MIVTEEQAKTKVCPERVEREHNPTQYSVVPFKCIGSACMAWRWDKITGDGYVVGTNGYCGKAGKP